MGGIEQTFDHRSQIQKQCRPSSGQHCNGMKKTAPSCRRNAPRQGLRQTANPPQKIYLVTEQRGARHYRRAPACFGGHRNDNQSPRRSLAPPGHPRADANKRLEQKPSSQPGTFRSFAMSSSLAGSTPATAARAMAGRRAASVARARSTSSSNKLAATLAAASKSFAKAAALRL